MIVGIDPGAHGAIAWIDDGTLISVCDMPTKIVRVSGKDRPRVDEYGLALVLSIYEVDHLYIENVGAHPRESSSAGFAFGMACGILRGWAGAVGVEYTLITPEEWKRGVGVSGGETKAKTKTNSRLRAIELFPGHADKFKRAKDDGRAEAALIALYGYKVASQATT